MTLGLRTKAGSAERRIAQSATRRRHVVSGLAVAAIAAGMVVLALGWRGAAGTVDLQEQLSYVVSGAVLGIALVGIGCAFAVVQADRLATRDIARAHLQLARQCRSLAGVLSRARRFSGGVQ